MNREGRSGRDFVFLVHWPSNLFPRLLPLLPYRERSSGKKPGEEVWMREFLISPHTPKTPIFQTPGKPGKSILWLFPALLVFAEK